jgi:hypothetical protein
MKIAAWKIRNKVEEDEKYPCTEADTKHNIKNLEQQPSIAVL